LTFLPAFGGIWAFLPVLNAGIYAISKSPETFSPSLGFPEKNQKIVQYM